VKAAAERKLTMKMTAMLFCALLLLVTAEAVPAQWAKHRDPRVPVSRDGKPNLSARTPRAADGKPDLSGVWWNVRDPLPKGVLAVEGDDFTAPRHMIDITVDLKPEQVQMEPWAEALFKKHLQAQGGLDPVAHCQPFGVPSHLSVYPPHKIVQTPRLIVILHEYQTVFRQIFLDGRKPVPDPNPTWNGYSTGRWEGDTLLVDTVGFNDRSWLDRLGHPHSEALHVTERFRRRDVGHMDVEVTIEDPKAYRKPIVYTLRQTLSLDEELLENFCTENEKDAPHYRQ
jgi:hypothetical protein